jgi:hypothetical protein
MARKSTKTKGVSLPDGVREPPSRHINRSVEATLWGRAAGQKAHICAFSPAGSCGHEGVFVDELNLALEEVTSLSQDLRDLSTWSGLPAPTGP